MRYFKTRTVIGLLARGKLFPNAGCSRELLPVCFNFLLSPLQKMAGLDYESSTHILNQLCHRIWQSVATKLRYVPCYC